MKRLMLEIRSIVCLVPPRKFIAVCICLSLLFSGFTSASMIATAPFEHNHVLAISDNFEPVSAHDKHHTQNEQLAQHTLNAGQKPKLKHGHNHGHELEHEDTHSSLHHTTDTTDSTDSTDCCEGKQSDCGSFNLICSVHCAVSIPISATTHIANYHALGNLLSSVTMYFPSVVPSAPFKPPRV